MAIAFAKIFVVEPLAAMRCVNLSDQNQGLLNESNWTKIGDGMTDVFPFLCALLADPRRVGAVMPSGAALAEAITREISPSSAPVVELGPGTGAFTQRLLERGVPENRLALIEHGPDFARLLQARYPHAQVLRMDATRLGDVQLFDDEKAGAVVSGIPLLSLSPREIVAILRGAFHHLRADGAFYQFTYGPRCPVPQVLLDRLGLKASRIGRAFVNVPPAGIYRITRCPPSQRNHASIATDRRAMEAA